MSSSKTPLSEEDLKNFCSVTGASIERAKFFVEAANGDIGIAIESFFDTNGGNDEEIMDEVPSETPRGFGLNTADDDEDEDDDDSPSFNPFSKPAVGKKEEVRKQPSRKVNNIFSFNDINNEEGSDDKGQAFYAGGSTTSGQQILGPKKNPEKIIKDLFEKAKEHGAQEVDQTEASTSKKTPVVYGNGYRLGAGGQSEVIPGPPKKKATKVSILKLWKNGFNVNDGDLRSYEDEKNKEFLASIQRGELPRELVNQAEGGEVHLDMQDHRDEEFVPPKQAYRLYNEGYKLGSTSSPPVVSNTSASDKLTDEATAKKNLDLDATKPSTQIQIRLSDGSRLIIKANLTHRISDLRCYINTARPEYQPRTYSLLTSFPNKELTNNEETIEQAKLQNAVIMQKV